MFLGLLFIVVITVASTLISKLYIFELMHLSPLIIGIILGIIYATIVHDKEVLNIKAGVDFSAKRLLKLGIILYGFRLGFNDIYTVGVEGIALSAIIVVSIILLALLIGVKVFKMDKDSALLVGTGTGVCGAAAILAMSQVMKKTESYKVTTAVAVIVILGIVCMILYPVLVESGVINLGGRSLGFFLGSSLHEVANVVGASSSFSTAVQHDAVIIKMIRVILLVPTLIIVNIIYADKSENSSNSLKAKLHYVSSLIPWFAFIFLLMIAVNSVLDIPKEGLTVIAKVDTFLLTMAMVSLGLNTNLRKFELTSIKDLALGVIIAFFAVVISLIYISFI